MARTSSEQIFDLNEELTACRAALREVVGAIETRLLNEKRFNESDKGDSYLQSYIADDFQRGRELMKSALQTHAGEIERAK